MSSEAMLDDKLQERLSNVNELVRAEQEQWRLALDHHCKLLVGVDFETVVRGTPGVDYVPVRETCKI